MERIIAKLIGFVGFIFVFWLAWIIIAALPMLEDANPYIRPLVFLVDIFMIFILILSPMAAAAMLIYTEED